MLTKSGVAPYCLKTGSSAVRDTCASFSCWVRVRSATVFLATTRPSAIPCRAP
jgi:hypothetical protein